MALHLSEPTIIRRGSCKVVGVYATYEVEEEGPGWGKPSDEGPAWGKASEELARRRDEIRNREGDTILGFLYRPHKDYPSVPEEVRSCFMGVEVSDVAQVPEGMATTSFTGGKYVIVESRGDTEGEAAMGVGDAINYLFRWIPEHGYRYREGDAVFTCSHEEADKPPFIEYVYIKLEELLERKS